MEKKRFAVTMFVLSLASTLAESTVPQVAIHYSGHTDAYVNSLPEKQKKNLVWLSQHPNIFLEETFRSAGIPTKAVTDADIASGALLVNCSSTCVPKYPILFSLATEAISDIEAGKIRDYVAAGGTVYAGSSAWTRYENGALRPNSDFAISELGLESVGRIYISHTDRVVPSGTTDRMLDHLAGAGPHQNGTEIPWYGSGYWDELKLDLESIVWGAVPSAAAPATIFLKANSRMQGFLPSHAVLPYLSSSVLASPQFRMRFGDVNGDGRDDLVYRAGGLIYVRKATRYNFGEEEFWTSWSTSYDFDIADIDGDGKADLVGRNTSTGDVQLAKSNGISFTGPSSQLTWWSPSYDLRFAPTTGGDDMADLIGRSSVDIQVAKSLGNVANSSTGWSSDSVAIAANTQRFLADVDADHDADLVFLSGSDVWVQRSQGNTFAPKEKWAQWDTSYNAPFTVGDVTGDGRADIVARSNNVVYVATSNGTSFDPARFWTPWHPDVSLQLADVDGDGRKDIVGCQCNPNINSPYDLGAVQVALSTGVELSATQPTYVQLAVKAHGAGKFIYNAEFVPTAGYGGFANDNTHYKTIEVAVADAFEARSLPLVTLAPWKFPFGAAMIMRHDHWLARDVHQIEASYATPDEKFGEYYLMPEQKWSGFSEACPDGSTRYSATCVCGTPAATMRNDYLAEAQWAYANGAVIGAHVIGHTALDWKNKLTAKNQIFDTAVTINNETQSQFGVPMLSFAFAAPAYYAIKKSTMEAIQEVGFLTTGEQGAGPFPHFAINPEATSLSYLGTLLELPTTEWPGYDNIERMLTRKVRVNDAVELEVYKAAAKLSYDLGGLVNVYDHAGGDAYGYLEPGVDACGYERTAFTSGLLPYTANLAGSRWPIWFTNSLSIREWWLQRERHTISVPTVSTTVSGNIKIDLGISTVPARATTTASESGTALRLTLTPAQIAKAILGIKVTLQNPAATETGCGGQLVRCWDGKKILLVKVGSSTAASIELGPVSP